MPTGYNPTQSPLSPPTQNSLSLHHISSQGGHLNSNCQLSLLFLIFLLLKGNEKVKEGIISTVLLNYFIYLFYLNWCLTSESDTNSNGIAKPTEAVQTTGNSGRFDIYPINRTPFLMQISLNSKYCHCQ